MITEWHCENIYSGKPSTLLGQDCFVTASSTPDQSPSSNSLNPTIVRDDGSLIFGVGIIIFFIAMIFFGLLFNSFKVEK